MSGVAILFGCGTLFMISLWLRELLFYWKRNWDFTIDSGISRAGTGTGGAVVREFSPKVRVLAALPFFIIMFVCLTVLAQLKFFGG